MRTVVVLGLLVAVALGGCLNDDDAATQEAGPSFLTEQEAAFGARSVLGAGAEDDEALSLAPSRDDWFLFSTPLSENGSLAAYRWTVPDEADIENRFGDHEVLLEVAPFLDGKATQLAFFAFREDGRELVPVSYYMSAELVDGGSLLFDLASDVWADPFYMDLGREVRPGDEVVFVAAGAGAGEVGMGLRILDADPWTDDGYTWPSDDRREFLDQVGDATVWVPELLGTGKGLLIDLYFEGELLVLGGKLQTPTLKVEESGLPGVGSIEPMRDTKLTSTLDSNGTGGFSLGMGLYFTSEAVGSWAVDADTFGTTFQDGGMIASAGDVPFASTAQYLLFGLPYYVVLADGEGSSSVSMSVQATHAGQSEFLLFDQVHLGASLEELTGMPGAQETYVWDGILGIEERSDHLALQRGDVQLIVPRL